MPNNSDLAKLVGSSGSLKKSGLPLESNVLPKNGHTDQNFMVDAFRNVERNIGRGNANFPLKGLINPWESNNHAVADNVIMECQKFRCSPCPDFVGRKPDGGLQPTSDYVESFLKFRDLSVTKPTQNSRMSIDYYDVGKIKIGRDDAIRERVTISSNIELRLGQPCQQSQSSDIYVPSVSGPKLLDTFVAQPKSLLLEQMTNNASNCGERVASMQYFQCSANPANVPARNVRNLNLGRHAFGISYVTDTIKLDKFDGNVTRSSMVPSLTNVNIPHERNANSKTNNHVAIGDQIIPKSFCSESYSAKSDQICVPRTVNGSERYLDVSELGFFRVNDKGKGVGCAADGSCAPEGSESNIPKQLESCGSFSGSIVGSRDPCSSAMHDRSHCAPQSCGVLPDVFDAINFFNHPEKVISLGNNKHTDNHFLKSKDLPNLATSASMSGMAPAVSKLAGTGVNPYLLDDNMRFLALGQILELSKQQHAMDQKTTTLGSFSIVNPFVEPSKFVEQTPGPCVTCQRGTSEMAMLSTSPGAYARLGVHTEKSGPVTDLNNACEFSTWMGGNLLRSREIDMQCKFPHGPPPTKELPLRSDHISSSIELGKCYQEVSGAYSQDRCNCAAHTKCSSRYCESRIGNTQNTLKVHVGTVNCETSLLVASEFVKDGTGVKEKTISSDRRAKMNGEVLKSNVCHSSEWKDVPSKFKGVSNVKYSDQSAEDLSDGRELKGPLRDTNTKCSYGTVKIHEPLKEQEMSNFSSGCSAAAVTQASIQGNNIDSSIANAGMTRYLNNHVVDEGSGIDKCCTSDDAFESEKSTEFVGSKCETDLRKEGSSKDINDRQSRSLLDELKLLNSLTWKKGRKQICSRLAVHGTINLKKVERDVKTGKRKRARKLKMLVSQCPAAGPSVHCGRAKGVAPLSCSSEDLEMLNPYIQETHVSGACPLQHRTTHGRSSLSLSKKVYRKTDHLMIYSDTDGEGDCQIKSNGNTNLCKIHEFSGVKELRRAWSPDCVRKSQMKEPTHGHTKDSLSCSLVGSTKAVSSCEPNIFSRQARPVVCGRFGEICSERTGDVSRPAKIVPLSRILKTSRRGTVPKNSEWKQTFLDELKKSSCINDVGDKGFYNMKNGEESVIHHSTFCNETSIDPSVEKDEKMCTNGDKQFDENAMLDKEIDHKRKKNCSALSRSFRTKFKEKRKRCLSELAENEQKSSSKSLSPEMICKCIPKVKTTRTAVDKHNVCASCKVNSEKLNQDHKSLSVMGSDAFCCVCGGSDNDEINCLLECSLCYIKVHQACYGVSRVPKGPWYCRPCRTNSRDIVCVLCGYGGGAMTRALHSRTIVKGLLEAWNVETENRQNSAVLPSEIMEDLNMSHSSESLLESSRFSVLRPVNIKPSATAAWKVDFLNQLEIYQKSSYSCSNVKVHNSITAGALDPTVKQWIHMVCGLWTPGTRCPNVDTMSAFDVSGASRPKANVVCSICNRPGGSCIQCRVVNCSVKFHPWCAHQKGLLQSEVEGVENESVGFYGRCVLHATHLLCESGCDPNDFEVDCSIEKEFTCARTEGYKGRKRDGFWHNLHGQSRGKTACLVPQEQLNAWVHINGMRLSTNGLAKLPVSDVDFNSRKEYVRNKQVKGRKHLVVYKSGIHALGLYTSRFISRGEMVVEYVGEIVGLRVADKREIEYQSGRKLQYKSACYFFRIDKEHIIDATSKGGIARFVNHSCMPNCVAEVISLRNEKKVVFFAERDIYPGEEITYDYHFNHEDEGKKIPCFCNSENCRRYLN